MTEFWISNRRTNAEEVGQRGGTGTFSKSSHRSTNHKSQFRLGLDDFVCFQFLLGRVSDSCRTEVNFVSDKVSDTEKRAECSGSTCAMFSPCSHWISVVQSLLHVCQGCSCTVYYLHSSNMSRVCTNRLDNPTHSPVFSYCHIIHFVLHFLICPHLPMPRLSLCWHPWSWFCYSRPTSPEGAFVNF